ncbi:two-component system nitrogen regulation response regulator GlnG [Xanthomonas campestris]|uniref:sigma 54-interacting transcriptional regulator n=1 Tax=Xanthomonas campestris TaxID=339 RepID=UPI002E028C49|nr:sigma 54-interacting transcriptional regulator [Xanthomonas campestris]MEC5193980.1 two-component system nitrogen regulation response regulator GlnG [Xanthomonas campestris]
MRAGKSDREATLSSPVEELVSSMKPMLGATVLWHPRHARIGEQALLRFAEGVWEISRHAPDFYRAGSDVGEGLEDHAVSRQPMRIVEHEGAGVAVLFPASRMRCAVDARMLNQGEEIAVELSMSELKRGVVLRLGEVLLCLGYVGLTPSAQGENPLVGVGPAIARVRDEIAQVARTDLPVLVLGETGTGKELVAQAIHSASARSHRAMVSVNMATLGESLAAADLFGAAKGAYTGAHQAREGYFAEANGGTLFLDEIGDTPAPVQPMLLRALETGEYRPLAGAKALHSDVRLIAATDRDLSTEGFNQPLLRRLEAFVVSMPPLRERREDIGVLILHFLKGNMRMREGLPPMPATLVQALCVHDWPGNVRQLGHVIRRLSLSAESGHWPSPSDVLSPAESREVEPTGRSVSFPRATGHQDRPRFRTPTGLSEAEVLDALDANEWRVQQAAQQLGISRPSLYVVLDAMKAVRRVENIPLEEIEAALERSPGDPTQWAIALRTPREALRRFVRARGLERA